MGRSARTSEEGKGSTFWFTAILEKQLLAGGRQRPTNRQRLQNAKVLIVDDNATNRSLVRGFLSSWGGRVEESTDGNAALAVLRQAADKAQPFQIAMLDMTLPGMTGEDLAKRNSGRPSIEGYRGCFDDGLWMGGRQGAPARARHRCACLETDLGATLKKSLSHVNGMRAGSGWRPRGLPNQTPIGSSYPAGANPLG